MKLVGAKETKIQVPQVATLQKEIPGIEGGQTTKSNIIVQSQLHY